MGGLKADPYTPKELARYLVEFIKERYAEKGDRWYEPFKGKGAFYDAMPEPKDWAEIDEGRDFFTYLPFDGHCEHIVTNPPYRMYINGKWSNGYIPSLERCLSIARKTVSFLTSHKIFNSLTPNRLQRYAIDSWVIDYIKVLNIKKWRGRYYFIVFKKHGNAKIWWDTRVW